VKAECGAEAGYRREMTKVANDASTTGNRIICIIFGTFISQLRVAMYSGHFPPCKSMPTVQGQFWFPILSSYLLCSRTSSIRMATSSQDRCACDLCTLFSTCSIYKEITALVCHWTVLYIFEWVYCDHCRQFAQWRQLQRAVVRQQHISYPGIIANDFGL
jgi:hypothetical protein